MRKRAILQTEVPETTPYENMVDLTNDFLVKTKPPKPKRCKSGFPLTISVHTWTKGNSERFGQLMRRRLTSDLNDRSFVYSAGRQTGQHQSICGYIEKRRHPFPKKTSHLDRVETDLWTNTVDWCQDGWEFYNTFRVTFKTKDDLADFCRVVKQRVSLNTKSIVYPANKERVYKYGWRSLWKDHNPQYPIYIVSKQRADSRYTSRTLEKINVPYHIVIEPQDYDEYSCVIDPSKILVLPFSNHGDGPGRARNWVWDHAKANGFKRHWVLDDNINGFFRLHGNRKYPILDGGMFQVCEEFIDRFENIPVAGLQYSFFCVSNHRYPPFVLNTRIYSCLLIENTCKFRWRGRYNEDTDLSLRVLKDGDCVAQFNALLQNKLGTQILKGGNTDEFYDKEGTWNKSAMLQAMHPDVVKTVWQFNRIHHKVNYRPFKTNKPRYVKEYSPDQGSDKTSKFKFERVKI